LVFSPVLILAVIVGLVACLAYRIRPVRALGSLWLLFGALRGTRVDIEHGRTAVLVTIT
jgi:hypothetical protein